MSSPSLARLALWSILLVNVGGLAGQAKPAAPSRSPTKPRLPARAATSAPLQSAPLTNLSYEVSFDSTSAAARTLKVAMRFDVAGPGPVILSFPAWTPGAYELTWYARWVTNFAARGGTQQQAGRALAWNKLDPDSYRIQPAGARTVSVTFDFLADSLDNAIAWAQPDFAFFNGTNVFPYPEGRGTDFPASVTIKTQPGWLVATGMTPGRGAGLYQESNYHDLVDKPFFIGRIDYDSTKVAGRWTRLASYPAGALSGPTRSQLWQQIGKIIPVESAVFQETPWRDYTVLMVFDSAYPGASALEHANSHLGIYTPQIIGNPLLASVTAHEIFHAWNVKRLRPAEMVPYQYDRMEPTPWLWVSEGITDYYADLAIVRPGVIRPDQFMAVTAGKIGTVAQTPPTALEDASLSTWIHPIDGSQYLYYQKGSLAGLLLDILIRDASDNHHSLDDVMRELYQSTYKLGRGFTGADWWGTVSRAAGGKNFADFNARYVDGREPYPWRETLPLAGMKLVADTIREPRLGLSSAQDSAGSIVVAAVQPGSASAEAGVKAGDRLLALGDIPVTSPTFAQAFRARFGQSEGDSLSIKVKRGTDTLTLHGKVKLMARVEVRIVADSAASPKAVRIRDGILKGTTDR
jgi:predicted metalloprotease with PDZ domain